NEIVIIPQLEETRVQRTAKHQSIKYIFTVVGRTRSHYQVREQGILLSSGVIHHPVPHDVCPTETLHIPIPVVLKSKFYPALLNNVIHRNARQWLNTCTFTNLVDVTNRYWLLAQFHCSFRSNQHRFGKPEAWEPHFAIASTG